MWVWSPRWNLPRFQRHPPCPHPSMLLTSLYSVATRHRAGCCGAQGAIINQSSAMGWVWVLPYMIILIGVFELYGLITNFCSVALNCKNIPNQRHVWDKCEIIPGRVFLPCPSCFDLDLIPSLMTAPYSYLLNALSLVIRPPKLSHRSLISIRVLVSSVVFWLSMYSIVPLYYKFAWIWLAVSKYGSVFVSSCPPGFPSFPSIALFKSRTHIPCTNTSRTRLSPAVCSSTCSRIRLPLHLLLQLL
jgi:hypothetical protein